MKTCYVCGEQKGLEEFHRNRSRKDGRQTFCKPCDYDLQVKRLYGVTVEEREALFEKGCAICGATEDLCVDHDHATGAVRAALCGPCNRMIGLASEKADRLRAAAAYVELWDGA